MLQARAVLFLIKRSFTHLTPNIFRPIHRAFVRPHLEYVIQAAAPYLKKDVDYIEKVQRLATRMVVALRDETYERRLAILRLQSLEDRRLRGDLILAFSIMTGHFDLPLEEFFTRPSMDTLRGHRLKLYHRRFRLNRRGAAFSVRIVNNWNKLPQSLINAPSVTSFTNVFDSNWDRVVSLVSTP